MWQYGADQELIPRVFITNYLTDGGDYQIALCNYAMRLSMHWKVHGICRSLVLYFSSTSVHQHMGAHVDHHTRVSLMQQICCTAVQFSAQQFSSLVHSSSVQQYIRSSTWAIRWCCTVLQFRACRSAHEGIARFVSACKGSVVQNCSSVHSSSVQQYISTWAVR